MEADNSPPSSMSEDAPDETEESFTWYFGLTWDLDLTSIEGIIGQEIVKDTLPLLSEGCNLLQQAATSCSRLSRRLKGKASGLQKV
jgi:hypothetical protein